MKQPAMPWIVIITAKKEWQDSDVLSFLFSVV
jgi:hypothetical protein